MMQGATAHVQQSSFATANGAVTGGVAAAAPAPAGAGHAAAPLGSQFVPAPKQAPQGLSGDRYDLAPGDEAMLPFGAPSGMPREQRFEAALGAREEGKGVKPRQGCASVQLNRECKEGTRTPAFVKFLEVVRQTADAEVLGQFGTNASSFDRADFMKVDRPLQFAGQVTDKYFNSELWQRMIPKDSGKGNFELRWLTRHVIAQHATAAKRQMRCNQIPRKMLQRLQMDHHRRNMKLGQEGGAPPEPVGHVGRHVGQEHDARSIRAPAQDHVSQPAVGQPAARERAHSGAAGGASVAGDRDMGGERAPWEKDKKVIQTTVARSRIESSLAAIQAQLRTGCVQGEVVHKTVQLTYALVFGTLGPMLQSVFNLSVLYQRDFQLCQQVLCTIGGALTRLFGSAWHMSLASILAPGMREFSIRLTATKTKRFDRLEVAVCFIWAALLQSAERNYVSQVVLDSWSSIPNGMWGEGRTDPVPGLQRDEAATAITICTGQAEPTDDHGSAHSTDDDSGSADSDAVSYVQPPAHYSEEKQRESLARRTDISQNGLSAQNMSMGMSASEGRQAWSEVGQSTGRSMHNEAGNRSLPRGRTAAAAATAMASAAPAHPFRAAAPRSEMMQSVPYSQPATAQANALPVPTALASPPYTSASYDSSDSMLPSYKRQRNGN